MRNARMSMIRRAMLILAFLMPPALAAVLADASAASPRHYDCSKAGNANKAACKGSTTAASAPATPSRTTTTTTAATTTTRHYDSELGKLRAPLGEAHHRHPR